MSSLRICVQDSSLVATYKDAICAFNAQKTSTHRDSGFDLFVPATFTTNYGDTYTLNHRVVCVTYDAYGDPEPFYMYPRSSISKTPLRVANCVGIIDSGYRGNLIGKMDHIKPTGFVDYTVVAGTRLLQICSHNLLPFENVELVDSLDETARGAGGFGSTGH